MTMENTMHGTTLGDQAATLGNQAVHATEKIKDGAAQATEKITESVEDGMNVARRFAHQASATLDDATRYFRESDSSKIAADLTQYVKNNPLPALAGAAVLGFVAGRLLRRD
jgi:ElaB/YqjD/DUF883 family membrane-anchored ribosome-binding protein